MRSVSVGMGAILPLRYPSYRVLRLAPLVVLILQGGALSPAAVPRAATSSGEVTVLSTVRSALPGEPVLALAFLDDARLAVLTPASVSVHRIDRSRFLQVARRDLPLPRAVVRTPGGLVLPGDDAFWALTSGMARAVLYALEGNRLVERAQADALPWPETSGGLRYREGTNLLDTPRGLLLTPPVDGLAIDAAGRLVRLSPTLEPAASIGSPQVGASLAALGEGRVVVSSAAPPGAPDQIDVFERNGDSMRRHGSIPVAGSVHALAVRRGPAGGFRVAAGVETAAGESVVLLLALRLASP
jgi:hypothetical protein